MICQIICFNKYKTSLYGKYKKIMNWLSYSTSIYAGKGSKPQEPNKYLCEHLSPNRL